MIKSLNIIVLVLTLLSAWNVKAQNLAVVSDGFSFDWDTIVEEDIYDANGLLWTVQWIMEFEQSASLGSNNQWTYNTQWTTTLRKLPGHGQGMSETIVQTESSQWDFFWSSDEWDFFGIYIPGGNSSPDVPLSYMSSYVDSLANQFYCPWSTGSSFEDRSLVGDWENTANFILVADFDYDPKHKLQVEDWENRDPLLGDNVGIRFQGVEFDLIYGEEKCQDSSYDETIFITPSGNGTFALPSEPPNGSFTCNGWPGGRWETAPDRDHTISHIIAFQSP